MLPGMTGQLGGAAVGQQGSSKDLWPQLLADLWSDPNVGYAAYGRTLATLDNPGGPGLTPAPLAPSEAAAAAGATGGVDEAVQGTQPALALTREGSGQLQQQQQGVGFSSPPDLRGPEKSSLAARRGAPLPHGPLPAGKAMLQAGVKAGEEQGDANGAAGGFALPHQGGMAATADIGAGMSHLNPDPSSSGNLDMPPPGGSQRPLQVATPAAAVTALQQQQQQQYSAAAVAPSVEQQRKEAGDEIFRRTLAPALSKFLSGSAASAGDRLSSPAPSSSLSASGAAQLGRQLKRPHRGAKKAGQEGTGASEVGGSLSTAAGVGDGEGEGMGLSGMEEGGPREGVRWEGRSAEEQAAEVAALTTAQRARRNRARASELAKALLPGGTGPQPGGGDHATRLPQVTGAHLGTQQAGGQAPVGLEGGLEGSLGGSGGERAAVTAAGSGSVGPLKVDLGGQAPDEDSDGPLPDIVTGPDDFP